MPPVTNPHHPPHPGGVPAQSRPRRWHPCRDAGVHVRSGPRWCRRFAPRPPATRWEASGFMADGRRGHLGCGHPRACRSRPSATTACWHAACRNLPAWGSRASLLLTRGFGSILLCRLRPMPRKAIAVRLHMHESDPPAEAQRRGVLAQTSASPQAIPSPRRLIRRFSCGISKLRMDSIWIAAGQRRGTIPGAGSRRSSFRWSDRRNPCSSG